MTSKKATHDELIDFYKKIASSLGLDYDNEGYLSIRSSDLPATVENKRLVLPTREILRRSPWDECIAFHPMSENIYRGESDVLRALKRYAMFRIGSIISLTMAALTNLASNEALHNTLTPSQAEILSLMPNSDAKTLDTFEKIINLHSTRGKNKLVNIYLKHGGRYKGEDFSRVSVVTFPITKEFQNADRTIFGVKLTVKDFKAFRALFCYILPDCEVPETYSFGSRDLSTPYLDCLLTSFSKIASALNKVVYKFKDHLKDDFDDIVCDLDWVEELGDLTRYIGIIPTLQGNDGELTQEDKLKLENLGGVKKHTSELAKEIANTPGSVKDVPPWENQPQQVPQQQGYQQQPAPSHVQQANVHHDRSIAGNLSTNVDQSRPAAQESGVADWNEMMRKSKYGQGQPQQQQGYYPQAAPPQVHYPVPPSMPGYQPPPPPPPQQGYYPQAAPQQQGYYPQVAPPQQGYYPVPPSMPGYQPPQQERKRGEYGVEHMQMQQGYYPPQQPIYGHPQQGYNNGYPPPPPMYRTP